MGRAEDILKGLASLREENMLCDIQLEAEGRHVSAHKAVLASASPYFRAMFCGNFKETTDQVVSMKEMSFIGLQSVVECIYATQITSINGDNIEHVLPTAHMLQMNDIVQELVEWMGKNIRTTNCFQFLEMAETFSIEYLQTSVTAFILKNFVDVIELTEFENISKATLIDYLASDTLKTNTDEFMVYKAARKWILANEVTDNDVVEIMSNVRLGLINHDQILKEISQDSFIQNNKKCSEIIDNAMQYHTNVFSQPFYEGTLNKPRGEAGLFMIPCGERDQGYNIVEDHINMEFYSFPDLKYSDGSSRLDIRIVFNSMSCVQVNNFLFLFGIYGQSYQNFIKRYDASTNQWIDLAAVAGLAVVGRATVRSGSQIYLLGGLFVDSDRGYEIDPDTIMDDMDVYDILQNSWSLGSDLPVRVVYAAGAELQGCIYLAGGEPADHDDNDFTLNQVWAYDITADIWLPKAPMNHRRYAHTLQAVGENLYAIGGRAYVGYNQNPESIEIYDPVANQWTIILDDVYDNFANSSFVVGNKIYLVGGNWFQDDVYEYDVKMKDLTHIGYTSSKNISTRNVSAFMVLPKLL